MLFLYFFPNDVTLEKQKTDEEGAGWLKWANSKRENCVFFRFLIFLAVVTGILVGMVKLNVGGVADGVLTPVIANMATLSAAQITAFMKK